MEIIAGIFITVAYVLGAILVGFWAIFIIVLLRDISILLRKIYSLIDSKESNEDSDSCYNGDIDDICL